MENQPPQQDTPLRPPTSGRKTMVPAGHRRPPGSGCYCIGGFALIFWQFVPKTEILVDYNPWFLDQVKKNNIKTISFQGVEIRGELRSEEPFSNPSSMTPTKVRKFYTYAPSEASIYPLEQELRKNVVRIESNPPNSANGLVMMLWLLPTFVILGLHLPDDAAGPRPVRRRNTH